MFSPAAHRLSVQRRGKYYVYMLLRKCLQTENCLFPAWMVRTLLRGQNIEES